MLLKIKIKYIKRELQIKKIYPSFHPQLFNSEFDKIWFKKTAKSRPKKIPIIGMMKLLIALICEVLFSKKSKKTVLLIENIAPDINLLIINNNKLNQRKLSELSINNGNKFTIGKYINKVFFLSNLTSVKHLKMRGMTNGLIKNDKQIIDNNNKSEILWSVILKRNIDKKGTKEKFTAESIPSKKEKKSLEEVIFFLVVIWDFFFILHFR